MYKIEISQKWKFYTSVIPHNSIALGTITKENGEIGALVKIKETGIYVQVNAGTIKNLDIEKINL